MKASELIKRLQELVEEVGDVRVGLPDREGDASELEQVLYTTSFWDYELKKYSDGIIVRDY